MSLDCCCGLIQIGQKMNYDLINIYKQVAQENDMSVREVAEIYRIYWKGIKDMIQALPFKKPLTVEEFEKLKVNFNLASLGKLYCTTQRYKNMLVQYEIIKERRNAKNEKSKTHVHKTDNNS